MIARLRRKMKAAADPARAAAMKAYMKSTMPYYGINLPEVRAITRTVFEEELTCDELRDTVLRLWRGARFREERYVAQMLLGKR
ncbi:MAG TPA: DNA alkylation repair protein, partial [Candidatus Dormibacteraeota bacterium]|nr:DNA alkylation repair protein [Candidatus Dormibacteraeota bacterium]